VLIQGELRSREYEKPLEGKKKTTVKQRILEIHITSILKLDRTERMDDTAPEQEQVERSGGPIRALC
jgi:single-stranded DNA-binding protein